MNKFASGFTIGGLQQKIINLVLILLLLLGGVFAAFSAVQYRSLNEVVGETREAQTEAIIRTSGATMHATLEESMAKVTTLRATIADQDFEEVVNDLRLLHTIAQGVFENRASLQPAPFQLPDPERDGELGAWVLHDEGVDYEHSELLGIAANLSDILISMDGNSDKIDGCYIGLADGTHLGVDWHTRNKYDENGELIPFPVTERPWYVGAAESGGLYFTGLVTDAFTGNLGITCSMPVVVDGETLAVVGMDIILDSMKDYVSQSAAGGASYLVNQEGQVVLAPNDSGLMNYDTEDEMTNVLTSGNEELAAIVRKALAEPTELYTAEVRGREYYLIGAPLPHVGWAVITAVDKELTEQATVQMVEEFNRLNAEAGESFAQESGRLQRLVLAAVLLVVAGGAAAALLLANRIVKPVEEMTRDIILGSQTGKLFEMKDIYRTKDEIEVLAEAFDELSKKTQQYIKDITRITREKERIGTELELARKIQADMLPNIYPAFPDRPEFDIYATMNPAKEVGGDFYDFFLIDEDHLGLVIADVSDKGVPAALFMMMSKILLKNFAQMGISPAEVLERTNTTICQSNDEEMFITAWFGVLEISTGKIVAANAGHEYPVIRTADGDYELMKDRHGFVLGGMDGVTYRDYEFTLEKGGTLFVYTDGVPEATNAAQEMYGTGRLLEAMNRHRTDGPVELLKAIWVSVDEFVGEAEQFDDLTMLAITLL